MAKQFHLPERAKYVEKSTPARAFFCDVCPIQMHTDFAEGTIDPLAMMGVKRFRGLPDFLTPCLQTKAM